MKRGVPIRWRHIRVGPSSQEGRDSTGTPRPCGQVERGKPPAINNVDRGTQVGQIVKKFNKVLSGTVVYHRLTIMENKFNIITVPNFGSLILIRRTTYIYDRAS